MADPGQDVQGKAIRELQRGRQMLDQVAQTLEQQREALKRYGIGLPPMVTNTVTNLLRDVSRLEEVFVEEQTEIGLLRTLAHLAAEVNNSLDANTVLEETMDTVIALTRADRGYILLFAEDGSLEFRVIREDMLLRGRTAPGQTPEISRSVLRYVLKEQQPLLADNAFQDERLQGQATVQSLQLRSVLCVPLAYRDQVIGAIYVDNRMQTGVFTDREKNLLMAFSNIAAVAIENARLYQQLQELLLQISQVKALMDNVFASIGTGIIAADAEDTIQIYNRAAEEILDMPADQAVGHSLRMALPRIISDFKETLSQVREKGETQVFQAVINLRDMRSVAVNIKLTPLKDSEAQVQGVAVVVDDLTERMERDQQMRIMQTYLPPGMVENIHTISSLALGGERRLVTCMFVEVRSLPALAGVRPREKMAILNTFLSVATEQIHAVGGVIDKYMGNEIMVLFNSQLNPMDDHARRAVDAALRLRDAFIALYASAGITADLNDYRAGIHTGIATLGNVGSLNRRDFTAIGDTINLAKRLEENAGRSQIILSEDSLHAIQAQGGTMLYKFVELAPIQVKGREQKTLVYEVFRNR